jgi:hypothetical protein
MMITHHVLGRPQEEVKRLMSQVLFAFASEKVSLRALLLKRIISESGRIGASTLIFGLLQTSKSHKFCPDVFISSRSIL